MLIIVLALVALVRFDDPSAEFNAEVVAFAREHLGKKVGDGICSTFIQEALRHAGAKVLDRPAPDGEYLWGNPVELLKDVKPGDIAQFEGVVFRSRRRIVGPNGPSLLLTQTSYPHHSAIVVAVGSGRRTITILHQNADGPDGTPVKLVQETKLVMSQRRKGGTLKFYRPIAP